MSKERVIKIKEKLLVETKDDFKSILVVTESGTFLIFKVRNEKVYQFKDALESGVVSVMIKQEGTIEDCVKEIKSEGWGDKMKCFWCENEIDEDERYLVVEIDEGKYKTHVCESCILTNEARVVDEFLKDNIFWLKDIDKEILQEGWGYENAFLRIWNKI